ncbi:NAD(P)-binding protein, partial [Lophiostoma macrostomum CBS 122681]
MADSDVHLQDFSTIFSLANKVAVVSGGSRGLGLHAASGLLQSGCSKVFITSRKASACEEAVAALNALPNKAPGARAYAVPADSSRVSEIERLVEEVGKQTDHVDILFANAGATWGAYFDDVEERNGWDKVMNLNVKAVFFSIQKFAPLLQKRATIDDPSRVIVTSSVAGIGVGSMGENAAYSYSASKAAVLHLARNLAVELGPRHILVNGLAPGFFPTKIAKVILERYGGEEKMSKESPNQRLGRPEDIAAAVVYLCSRAGGHVNGNTLVIDGGKILGSTKL